MAVQPTFVSAGVANTLQNGAGPTGAFPPTWGTGDIIVGIAWWPGLFSGAGFAEFDSNAMTQLVYQDTGAYDFSGGGSFGAWYWVATYDSNATPLASSEVIVDDNGDISQIVIAAQAFSDAAAVSLLDVDYAPLFGATDGSTNEDIPVPVGDESGDEMVAMYLFAGYAVGGTTALSTPAGHTSRGALSDADAKMRYTSETGTTAFAAATSAYTDTTAPNTLLQLYGSRLTLAFSSTVPNISPDVSNQYERLQYKARALPFYLDSGLLRRL